MEEIKPEKQNNGENIGDNVNLKKRTVSGVVWRVGERVAAQLVSAIIGIILARLIIPEEYGIVSLTTILIIILNVFISSGFGTALVQKKEANNLDFSSVLYMSIGISVILYAIIFFTAPLIVKFYDSDLIAPVIRVMGISFPLTAINSVQQAYVSRTMQFKKFFFATFIGTVVSGIVGIIMAYSGYGVWALVAQYLINAFMDTVILAITIKWMPVFAFSGKSIKSIFPFGSKILISSFINTVFIQLKGLIIGKKSSSSDFAYYEKGKHFPERIIVNSDSVFSSVILSLMSKVQDDKVKIKDIAKKTIRYSTYVLMPCLIGFAAIGKNFVHVILTDNWLPILPFLYIVCASYLFQPLHNANTTAISATGRAGVILKLEIIKKVTDVILVIIATVFGNAIWIALTSVVTSVVSFFINAYPNREFLGYGYLEQLKDTAPAFLLSVCMGVAVFFMNYLPINAVLLLVLQVIVGVGLYIVLSLLFKCKSFYFVLAQIKKAIAKIKKS